MKKQFFAAMLAVLSIVSCTNQYEETSGFKDNRLLATIDPFDETRAVIQDQTLQGGSFAYWWCPGDEIGVFTDANEKNVKYTINAKENTTTALFTPSKTVSGTPTYAYYPYSADAGTNMSALEFNFDNNQTINVAGNNIPGIARYGYYKTTTNGQASFGFKHVLSTVRFNVDATGTKMEGCRVKSISVKAVRNFFFGVPVCGEYTFNAQTGAYKQGDTSNQLTIEFEGAPTLDNAITYVTSMLPAVKKNDRLHFTVTGYGYTATFYVVSSVTLAQNGAYTFDLTIKKCNTVSVKKNSLQYVEPEQPTDPEPETPVDPEPENPTDPENPEGGDNGDDNGDNGDNGDNNEGGNTDVPTAPVEPEVPVVPTPEVVTGTFKCATYNIKSSTNSSIGTYITNDGWDFFGFSEDFGKYSKNLSGYAFGKRSGSALSGSSDGLGFATRTATCSWSGEYIDAYDSEYGGLFAGANTVISKGFRHYVVTMKDGVEVDVYITHMNTYDTQKHLDCQHAQLKEVATYIANHQNGRPVIFMGDTNCRYTRHDFETYFWSILRNAGLEYADPWVEYQWNGAYPTYPSKSLMVSDATGTNSDTDIICSTTQNGEVVDKVIYINKPTNKVQIKANNYLRDMDYNGLSDHMPIVVDFTYSYTK